MMTKIYPRTGDKQTVYLNTIMQHPQIVGLAYRQDSPVFTIHYEWCFR